jgi:hypothetical protein
MLKHSMSMLTAMTLVSAFAAQAQAASPQVMVRAGDRYADTRETWQPAHFSSYSHYHQCTPSPCKKLKYRHKRGHGWGSPSSTGLKLKSR